MQYLAGYLKVCTAPLKSIHGLQSRVSSKRPRRSSKTATMTTSMQRPARALTLTALLCLFIETCSFSVSKTSSVTIAVCTDIDCRLDGASDALRALQRNAPDGVRVTGRACLGPCGDGPCVVVLNSENKRVIEEQKGRVVQGSLVPPDLFGVNPRGVYQVRNAGNVEQVVGIAAAEASLDVSNKVVLNESDSESVVVTSTRRPFDRPRNERKVLQRLMQFLVLVGLYSHENVQALQFEIAFGLFLLSDLIMKENIFTFVWMKVAT